MRFYTVAQLVNNLLEANEKGTLGKLYKQIETLDLLILDELGYVPLHKQGAELLFQVINLSYESDCSGNDESSIRAMEPHFWRSNTDRGLH